MRRHLTCPEAIAALRRGKVVEQLLALEPHNHEPVVRWLSVSSRGGAFGVTLHLVHDPCDPTFLDLSEFAPVNEDEDVGEGTEAGRAADPEEALHIATQLGAASERWVNEFVVAEEYRDAHGWS
ncbi:hypothetical protein DVA67_036165 [Solirubrobacter sp. CPCC 204708]|uniref:Immunity protein Imm1 n=1 Tax=Solirubrobacter deserti TaxID=2282478 RepID=A0ABT4RWH0_9ACTN|nr:hypothetical protein [Solirubrobacter deserti]MBE2321404.1 hypothetical protein [Solirubrobacter deserti]MDA0142611.1 hypothetical protein [Solirubrobacter deserti]